jgi:hypothetical protein
MPIADTFAVARVRRLLQAGSSLIVDGSSTGGTALDTHTRTQATSASTPLLTVSKAIQLAQPGDSILVRRITPGGGPLGDGTYGDWEALNQKKVQAVNVAPYPGDEGNVDLGIARLGGTTFVNFDGVDFNAIVPSYQTGSTYYTGADMIFRNFVANRASIGRSQRLLFEDFEFDGGADYSTQLFTTSGSLTTWCEDITLKRGVLHKSKEAMHLGKFKRFTMEDIEIYDVQENLSTDHPDAVQWFWDNSSPSEDFVGRRIHVHDCTAQGWFTTASVNRAYLENLLVHDILGGFVTADFFQGDDLTWVNCTVDGKLRFAAKTATNARIVNTYAKLVSKTGTTNPTPLALEKANIWGQAPTVAGLAAADASSVVGLPTFVNTAIDDYRLAGGSVGKGIGVTTAGSGATLVTPPTTDRLGRTRTGSRDPGSDQS